MNDQKQNNDSVNSELDYPGHRKLVNTTNSDKINKALLQHVEEGVFFINEEFLINDHYSLSLEKIFGLVDLENKNFINLLENKIPTQIIDNTREFLELMFRNDLDEDVISELNPLTETEFFYEDEWGIWTSSKYLSFSFKRIIENGKTISLVSTIQDVTEKVLLTKKIQHIEEHTKKQMEWLVNILHVEPDMLKEFFCFLKVSLLFFSFSFFV